MKNRNKKTINNFGLFVVMFVGLVIAVINLTSADYKVAIDGDYWGYLAPAIESQNNNNFTLIFGRTFPYPMFLSKAIFWGELSFFYLLIIQSIMFILSGVIIFSIIVSAVSDLMEKSGFLTTILVSLISLSSSIIFYTYSPIQFFMMALRPEMVSIFISLLLIYLLIKFHNHLKHIEKINLTTLFSISVLAGGLAVLNSKFLILSGFLFLLTILSYIKKLNAINLTVVSVATLLFILPFYIQKKIDDDPQGGKAFGIELLFCTTLDIQVKNDFGNYENKIEEKLKKIALETLAKGPSGYQLLGFNPDICLYDSILSVYNLYSIPNYDKWYILDIMKANSVSAIVNNPTLFFRKIGKQVSAVLRNPYDRGLFGFSQNITIDEDLVLREKERLSKKGANYALIADQFLERSTVDMKKLKYSPPNVIVFIFAPLFIIFVYFLNHLDCSIVKRSVIPLLILLSAVLMVAIVHSFDVGRFRDQLSPLFILAGGYYWALIIGIFSKEDLKKKEVK